MAIDHGRTAVEPASHVLAGAVDGAPPAGFDALLPSAMAAKAANVGAAKAGTPRLRELSRSRSSPARSSPSGRCSPPS